MQKKKNVYLQIVDELDTRIEQNVYKENELLPSDYKLAAEFDVSRLTIRRAIDYLVQQKKLVKEPGIGTYIMQNEDNRVQSGRGGLQSFSEAAKHYGLTVRSDVLTLDTNIPTTQELMNIFKTANNQQTFHHLKRIRYGNDEPMTLEDIYLKTEYAPLLTMTQAEGSIYNLLEQTVQIAYSHQDIEAILIDEALSQLLSTPVGMPAFRITSTAHAVTGETIMYDISYYRADKYTIKETLYRDIT